MNRSPDHSDPQPLPEPEGANLDRLLTRFFQSEIPQHWPAQPVLATPQHIAALQPTSPVAPRYLLAGCLFGVLLLTWNLTNLSTPFSGNITANPNSKFENSTADGKTILKHLHAKPFPSHNDE